MKSGFVPLVTTVWLTISRKLQRSPCANRPAASPSAKRATLPNRRESDPSRPTRSGLKQQFAADPLDNSAGSFAIAEVGKHERSFASCPSGIAFHPLQTRSDVRRQINLVDDQQPGGGDPRPAF